MPSPRDFPPFSALEGPSLRKALAAGEERSLRAERALWYQGDRAESCCLVLEGKVKCSLYRSDESSLDLGVFGPGEWLGLAELLLSGPCAHDALALEPCRVFELSRDGLEALLSVSPAQRWFLSDLARRQYALYSRVEQSRPLDRLLAWLEAARGKGRIAVTQDELAAAIGSTRETVNRHLSRLQEEGRVELGRGWIALTASPPPALDPPPPARDA